MIYSKTVPDHPPAVAYGRYWGALERVDCLHFEACYYQPIDWCIAHGVARFEGGAQGEHKMARALLPVQASSAHWLAHPGFADAVDRFLDRERDGVRHTDGQATGQTGRLDAEQVHQPGTPCTAGPWITKSAAGSPGPLILGRMPA
jgi:hypothetical protein